jgi:hypothetical protein
MGMGERMKLPSMNYECKTYVVWIGIIGSEAWVGPWGFWFGKR